MAGKYTDGVDELDQQGSKANGQLMYNVEHHNPHRLTLLVPGKCIIIIIIIEYH